MGKRLVALIAYFLVATVVTAGTNTPFPAGTRVSVTSSAGTVTGTLQDVDVSQWIGVRESDRTSTTYVRGVDVIVRAIDEPATVRGAAVSSADRATFDRRVARDIAEDIATTDEPTGHYIFGRPVARHEARFRFRPEGADEDVAGITFLAREAFTLGHIDRLKSPAWVAMRWSKDDFVRSEQVAFERGSFVDDDDLPMYARSGTNLQFTVTRLERGHMARDADLEGWGFDSVREGMRMSNIVPQLKGKNHIVWGKLEDQHRFIVADPDTSGVSTVWVISGPVFDDENGDGQLAENEIRRLNNGKGVPGHTYKIIAWFASDGELNLRAYVIAQNDTDTDLRHYLKSVDEIEQRTGLDFFPLLDDEIEEQLESQLHSSLWN